MDEKEKQPEPKQMQVIKTERQLLCSRFSPDGTHLVAGGMDAKVHRWMQFEVELEDNDESKNKKGDKKAWKGYTYAPDRKQTKNGQQKKVGAQKGAAQCQHPKGGGGSKFCEWFEGLVRLVREVRAQEAAVLGLPED